MLQLLLQALFSKESLSNCKFNPSYMKNFYFLSDIQTVQILPCFDFDVLNYRKQLKQLVKGGWRRTLLLCIIYLSATNGIVWLIITYTSIADKELA